MCFRMVCLTALIAVSGFSSGLAAGPGRLDLTNAVVVQGSSASPRERRAARLLIDEVEKRTAIRWKIVDALPVAETPAIVVGRIDEVKELAMAFADRIAKPSGPLKAEGYRLVAFKDGRTTPTIIVFGNDERGVLFGCGRLLRELRMTPGSVHLDESTDLTTAPALPLRGHQLGYRPKTNSYDAWSPEMWEQYMADLAVFGSNAIELIPPRSDDADQSPHFPLPKIDMMERMSRIADEFGLDVWIWFPALDRDYSNPETVEFALKEWGEVFARLPRIDAIFVPGGDPGHTQPKFLLKLLEKQTASLRKHHPKAQMWVSPQSFDQKWLDEFLGILKAEQPKWLSGIVYGPQNRIGLSALREQTPKQYPIRNYPDITHSLRAQLGVPNWDLAYALTENREVINPRPMGQAEVFRLQMKDTIGFLTYSEGCNDDVNKIVWSSLGWNPEANVAEAMREYARYFIGADYEEEFAQGLLALENNWKGPLLKNDAVAATFDQFRAMERRASPRTLHNWRFQQGLFRAYFDAYERNRLIDETKVENEAMDALRSAGTSGSLEAMKNAEEILNRPSANAVSAEMRVRIFQLAEALFQTIRMQLSVPLYKAIGVDRGAHLDLIDFPLTNAPWLKAEFAKVRQSASEKERLEAIGRIVNWADPGPGGFYDELGDPSRQPHLVRGPGWATDPEFRESARTGFRIVPGERTSWMHFAESTYDAPLKMHYNGLSASARYKIRVIYGDPTSKVKLRLVADEATEVHSFIDKTGAGQPAEFDIPAEATRDGALTLTWSAEPGRGGTGRGCQIAEAWLIKTADGRN